jgi:hypothetical protein
MHSSDPPRPPGAYLARWFVLLGILALVPVAGVFGGHLGDLLRHPSLGPGELLRSEAPLMTLAVAATFALSTAHGLSRGQTWAILLGLTEAGFLALAGLAMLTGNAGILDAIGAPQVLALALIPAGISAALLGARLSRALWHALGLGLPFGRSDLRALGALAAVAVVALLGHLLAAGIAS